jgi:hypothetical protein
MYYDGYIDDTIDLMHDVSEIWNAEQYDKIFFLYTEENSRIVDDNRRCLDIDFRDKINYNFLKYFDTPDEKTVFSISSRELFSEEGQNLVDKIYSECFLGL